MVASSNKSPCCTVVLAIDCRPALIRFHSSGGDGELGGVQFILNFHYLFIFLAEEGGDNNTADSLFCARCLMTFCDALIKFLSDEHRYAQVSVVFALQMQLCGLNRAPQDRN